MPDTNKRKNSESAIRRMSEKYYLVDDERNPQNIFPPIRKDTDQIRELMNGKNYIRILTEIGLYKYILIQYYIYCEEDIWMCGDAFVFNQNPDKKILAQVYCSKARKQCCAYDESSHEFLTLCPSCKKIMLGLKNTPCLCRECGYKIPYNKSLFLPYLKLDCEVCPANLGWKKVWELDNKFYTTFLNLRQDTFKMLQSEYKDLDLSDFRDTKTFISSLVESFMNVVAWEEKSEKFLKSKQKEKPSNE